MSGHIFIGLSGPRGVSLELSAPHGASLGLSGPLFRSLGLTLPLSWTPFGEFVNAPAARPAAKRYPATASANGFLESRLIHSLLHNPFC